MAVHCHPLPPPPRHRGMNTVVRVPGLATPPPPPLHVGGGACIPQKGGASFSWTPPPSHGPLPGWGAGGESHSPGAEGPSTSFPFAFPPGVDQGVGGGACSLG